MEFSRAFSYVFEDSDWFKKIALAALVSLIPIIGQIFLIGWALEITSRVIKKRSHAPAGSRFWRKPRQRI